jgi:hypothetical protein
MRKHRYLVTRQEGLKGITEAVVVEADTTDRIETCEDLLDEIRDKITWLREETDSACGDFNIGDLMSSDLQEIITGEGSSIKNLRLLSLDLQSNDCWYYDTVLHHDLEEDAYESSS